MADDSGSRMERWCVCVRVAKECVFVQVVPSYASMCPHIPRIAGDPSSGSYYKAAGDPRSIPADG